MTFPRWVDRLQRGGVFVTAALFSAGYAAIGLVLLLVTAIAESVAVRRLPWAPSPVDLWLGAFLGTFLLSGWLSPYRALALGSTGLAALTIYVSLGVTQRVVRRDNGFLVPLIWTWLAGAVATGIVGYVAHLRTEGGPAVTGVLGQNAVGTTLLIALMLGVAMIMIAPRGGKLLAVVAVAVITAVLTLTFTRGAWLGAAVGLAVMGALTRTRYMRTGGVLVVVLALAAVASSDAVRSQIVTRARFDDRGTLGRIAIAQSALEMFTDHPVLGTGMNTFAMAYPAYRRPGEPNPGGSMPFAHNIWLNMAAEGGVVGVLTFAGVLLASLASGWRWYRKSAPTGQSVLAAAALAATVGTLVHQLFDGTILSVHLGAGFWMLVGILTSPRQTPDDGTRDRRGRQS